MAAAYGIADTSNSMNATFFDYNNDGYLDLYVLNNVDIHVFPSNYRKKITDGTAPSTDRLYRNNGDNTFTDVSNEAGITIEGYGLGIATMDINMDGLTDIYVSNDYLSNDILYVNNGNGTFTDRIDDYMKHQSKFSMGNDVSDFNNDGYVDVVTLDMMGETNHRLKTMVGTSSYTNYILNEQYDYGYQYSRNMLQKGNGPGVPHSEIGSWQTLPARIGVGHPYFLMPTTTEKKTFSSRMGFHGISQTLILGISISTPVGI